MKKELICINCPLGCRLCAEMENETVVSVTGNGCPRGEAYARQEAVCPMRIFTGNMKADGCMIPFSVRTDRPIPRSLLLTCAKELKKHHPTLPIHAGDVVLAHILGTSANVIATQSLDTQTVNIHN